MVPIIDLWCRNTYGKLLGKAKKDNDYYYYYDSKLLRGLYIDNNLYTVSENAVKVNNLDTLELVNELKIKE